MIVFYLNKSDHETKSYHPLCHDKSKMIFFPMDYKIDTGDYGNEIFLSQVN